jgi:hypothetical protein
MSLEVVAASASRGLLRAYNVAASFRGPVEVSVDALATPENDALFGR